MAATSALAKRRSSAAVSALALCIMASLAACSTSKTTSTAATSATPAATPSPQVAFENTDFRKVQAQLLAEVNKQRASQKLKPLAEASALDDIALAHSRVMAQGDFLSDRGPNEPSISVRIGEAGSSTEKVAENIARSYLDDQHVVDDVVQSWLNTPNAKKNLLSDKYKSTGIGIVRTTDGQAFVTEDFSG